MPLRTIAKQIPSLRHAALSTSVAVLGRFAMAQPEFPDEVKRTCGFPLGSIPVEIQEVDALHVSVLT